MPTFYQGTGVLFVIIAFFGAINRRYLGRLSLPDTLGGTISVVAMAFIVSSLQA